MSKLVRRIPFGRASRLEVAQHELENGLTILSIVDHVAPVVAYQSWLRVGSAYEQPDKTGLAHLFEHLMFNESENLAPGVFDRKLEELGAQNNAATWLDWTYYHEIAPAESLPEVMALEAERLAHLKIQTEQLEKEREVVANERRLRVEDDVTGTMDEKLHLLAYHQHPYRWPTIGWMEHILNFTVEDCREFYRTFYAPNNVTLVIAGDFDEADTLARTEDLYGALDRQDVPVPPDVAEPPQTEERREVISWPMSASRLSIGYPVVSLDHPDHAPLTAANEVLFGGRSGRLRARLTDEEELVSDVFGWVPPLRWPGLHMIHAALREGRSWERVVEIIDEEIERLAETGPTTGEMEKATARSERSFFEGLDSADGKAEKLGFFHTALDDFQKLFERVERLEKVTPDDIVRVVETYFRHGARSLVVAEPATEGGEQ